MSETLRFFLLQIALLAIVLVLHTYLGLHIIRRTLVFSDLVLAQLAAFGGLVAVGLGIEYGTGQTYLASLIAVMLGAALLALINPRNSLIPREAVIGILFALALVSCLLVGDKLAGGSGYVTKTLEGSMLWVSWPLVCVTAGVYGVLLAFHYAYREKFIALTQNRRSGINEKWWDFLFFMSQGIITVLIVPVAGVLLAYAFLMIPAAIAAMFTKKWAWAVVLGWSIGFVACVIGLMTSYRFDLPYGPTLVLALGTCFVAAVFLRAVLSQRSRLDRKEGN